MQHDDVDPRKAYQDRLTNQWQGPRAHRHNEYERDPRADYVNRLQDAWQRGDDEDEEGDGNLTIMEHRDAAAAREVRFRDALSFDAAIPSGLPTGTAVRLIRDQQRQRGAA
jgi:hypothetical protein